MTARRILSTMIALGAAAAVLPPSAEATTALPATVTLPHGLYEQDAPRLHAELYSWGRRVRLNSIDLPGVLARRGKTRRVQWQGLMISGRISATGRFSIVYQPRIRNRGGDRYRETFAGRFVENGARIVGTYRSYQHFGSQGRAAGFIPSTITSLGKVNARLQFAQGQWRGQTDQGQAVYATVSRNDSVSRVLSLTTTLVPTCPDGSQITVPMRFDYPGYGNHEIEESMDWGDPQRSFEAQLVATFGGLVATGTLSVIAVLDSDAEESPVCRTGPVGFGANWVP